MKCITYYTKIENQRGEFINDIRSIQTQFRHFEHINIIKYCLNMTDSLIFNPFANFIKNILSTFKEEEKNINNGIFKSCHNVFGLQYMISLLFRISHHN